MKIAILALDQCIATMVVSPLEILYKTAMMHSMQQPEGLGKMLFQIDVVGARPMIQAVGGFPLNTSLQLDQAAGYDLVFVPAVNDLMPFADVVALNRPSLDWLMHAHSHGATVASVCTGAFMLGAAGLLRGKPVTTHWQWTHTLQQLYPDAEVRPERVLVDAGTVITAGGSTAYLNLLIYLIEKYAGMETAQLAARQFLIDLNKGPQLAYAMFNTQKGHTDDAIRRAQAYIEEQVDSSLSLDEVAAEARLGKRTLIRRFKDATGNTPHEYIRRVKLERVKKLLCTCDISFEEAAYRVGYTDAATLRQAFKDETGLTPREYRQRFTFQV